MSRASRKEQRNCLKCLGAAIRYQQSVLEAAVIRRMVGYFFSDCLLGSHGESSPHHADAAYNVQSINHIVLGIIS